MLMFVLNSSQFMQVKESSLNQFAIPFILCNITLNDRSKHWYKSIDIFNCHKPAPEPAPHLPRTYPRTWLVKGADFLPLGKKSCIWWNMIEALVIWILEEGFCIYKHSYFPCRFASSSPRIILFLSLFLLLFPLFFLHP